MNHSFQIKLIVVPLLLLYADFLSAQERDLFKQLIKESIKADLKEQLMQSDAISIDTFYGSFIPPYTDSLSIEKQSELSEYITTPYTNPKYNPGVSGISKYENMIPTVMYKEMSGAGVISVSGLMNLIGFRRKNKKGQVSFSEKEKEIINEKTNELITIELMGDSLDINKENLTEIIE